MSGGWRLTKAQQAIVTVHAYLIDLKADKIRTSTIDRNERLSAAALALVEAAHYWRRGRGRFATYAGIAMERAISRPSTGQAWRLEKRQQAPQTILLHTEKLDQIVSKDPSNEVDERDLLEHYLGRFHLLTLPEQSALTRLGEGKRSHGKAFHHAAGLAASAAAKLRRREP